AYGVHLPVRTRHATGTRAPDFRSGESGVEGEFGRYLGGTGRHEGNRGPAVKIPRWRIAAAAVVLAGLIGFLAMFTPIYIRNLRLQSYVSGLTQTVENTQKSDDLLRTWVLDKAHELNLPVAADNVQIRRSGSALQIDVRYFVRVDLPGY